MEAAAIASFGFLDYASTLLSLQLLAVVEMNPVIAVAIEYLGAIGLLAVKVLAILLIIGVARKTGGKAALVGLGLVTVAGLLITVSNISGVIGILHLMPIGIRTTTTKIGLTWLIGAAVYWNIWHFVLS